MFAHTRTIRWLHKSDIEPAVWHLTSPSSGGESNYTNTVACASLNTLQPAAVPTS